MHRLSHLEVKDTGFLFVYQIFNYISKKENYEYCI